MLEKSVKMVLNLLLAALVFFVAGSPVFAQLQPRMSPWLHMFDRPTSDVGNYLGTVRPQQDLMRAQAQQAQQIQAQQRALQSLQSGAAGGGSAGSRDLAVGSGVTSGGGLGGVGNARDVLSPPREVPRVNRNPAGFNQYLHYPSGAMPRKPVPNFSATGRR